MNSESEIESVDELIADGVMQKWTRIEHQHSQSLVGLYCCDFQVDQSRFIVNVPIHPPLEYVPSVEAVAMNGDVRFRLSDRQKFGVRMEVIRSAHLEKAEKLFVEIIIESKSDSHRESHTN